MKAKLKLFAFTHFNPDYTSGLAVAIAKDETDARKLIEAQGPVSEWGAVHQHPLNRRVAYRVSGGFMPLIDPNLKLRPHSIDQEPSVDPEPRHPADVIDQMLKVVPEEYKHRLRFLFKSISRYMAPELLRGSLAWDQIQSAVMQMVPPPPQKLTEEWQLKVVAILMNKSEDVIKKHFGKE